MEKYKKICHNIIFTFLFLFPLTSHSSEAFGNNLGSFNNVINYSNCSTSCVSCNSNCATNNYIDGNYIGIKWQCVEYIRRYYYEVYGMDLASLHRGNANTFYTNASTMGLSRYPNGGSVKPAIGDILVSEGGGYGHVAIIRSVTNNEVCSIQQNFTNTSSDTNLCRTLTYSGGTYTLAAFNSSGSYAIRGWLRKPTTLNLISPINNYRANSSTVNFSWSNESNVNAHRIVISTDEAYIDGLNGSGDWCIGKSSSTCYTGTISDTSSTISATLTNSTLLTNGRKYFWKVRSSDGAGTTYVSGTETFYRPISLSLSSPSNGASVSAGSVTLSWNSIGGTAHRYILSTDNTFISNLPVNGTWTCPNNSSSTCKTYAISGTSKTITDSTLLSSGKTFYWKVRASEPNPDIPDEMTSMRSFSIPTTSTYPDLIVQSPSVNDSTLTPGQSFTISATVKNQGAGSAASSTLRYYRSTNSNITASDTLIGTDSVTALLSGATSPESITVSAPTTAGTYYIGACVDSVSGESSTTNNCSSGVAVTVNSNGSDDYGNTIQNAHSIVCGNISGYPDCQSEIIVNGIIETGDDYDVFMLDFPSSGIITIWTTGTTDTKGELYNSAEKFLQYNDDEMLGNLNFKLFKFINSERHYLKVYSYSDNVGSYTLHIRLRLPISPIINNYLLN